MFSHHFPSKDSGVKIYFYSAVSHFRAHFEGKKKNTDPSYESVQSFHFSAWPKLGATCSQIKVSSQEINVILEKI